MNIIESIRKRRSVRTFDASPIDSASMEKLSAFMADVKNPFDIPVTFKFLDAKEHGLTSPVVSGSDLYIGGKVKMCKNFSLAYGYSFEALVLYAQSLDIGTVWMGGTMNRPAFEKAMCLEDGEVMPCTTPVGYAAKKMTLRESMMRKGINADSRFDFEKTFFSGSFATPLTKENAGRFLAPLEMVSLAPSAVNKQPWRVVVCGNTAHFYLKRSKGFGYDDALDMQMIDVGIAQCHFALSAEELGLKLEFVLSDPQLETPPDTVYAASYKLV